MQIAIIVLLLVLSVGGAFYYKSSTSAPANTETPATTEVVTDTTKTETPTDTKPAEVSAMYKDGTYTKTGTYKSPAGTENVEVTLTLAKDVVTDAVFKGLATNPGSVANQKKFADGFKGEVVGKSIDAIALTVVNGSSLSPKGFMDAVAQIKTEAHI